MSLAPPIFQVLKETLHFLQDRKDNGIQTDREVQFSKAISTRIILLELIISLSSMNIQKRK